MKKGRFSRIKGCKTIFLEVPLRRFIMNRFGIRIFPRSFSKASNPLPLNGSLCIYHLRSSSSGEAQITQLSVSINGVRLCAEYMQGTYS